MNLKKKYLLINMTGDRILYFLKLKNKVPNLNNICFATKLNQNVAKN